MIKADLVCFLLACLLVLFHIIKLVFIGHLAVYCFFLLSGYWVFLVFETKNGKAKESLFVLYCSRNYRLLPVYYLISIFTFIMILLYDSALNEKLNFTAFSGIGFALINFFMLVFNQLSFEPSLPAWSLDIELQIYLLVSFFLFFFKTLKYGLLFIAFGIFFTLVLTLVLTDLFISKTIIKYLVFFPMGLEIFKSKIEFKTKIEIANSALFFGILLFHYIISDLLTLVNKADSYYNEIFNILSSFLLIYMLSNSVIRKRDSNDILFGGMSYRLYLKSLDVYNSLYSFYRRTYYARKNSFYHRL